MDWQLVWAQCTGLLLSAMPWHAGCFGFVRIWGVGHLLLRWNWKLHRCGHSACRGSSSADLLWTKLVCRVPRNCTSIGELYVWQPGLLLVTELAWGRFSTLRLLRAVDGRRIGLCVLVCHRRSRMNITQHLHLRCRSRRAKCICWQRHCPVQPSGAQRHGV